MFFVASISIPMTEWKTLSGA